MTVREFKAVVLAELKRVKLKEANVTGPGEVFSTLKAFKRRKK